MYQKKSKQMLHIILVLENQIAPFKWEFIKNIYSLPKIDFSFTTLSNLIYKVNLSSKFKQQFWCMHNNT